MTSRSDANRPQGSAYGRTNSACAEKAPDVRLIGACDARPARGVLPSIDRRGDFFQDLPGLVFAKPVGRRRIEDRFQVRTVVRIVEIQDVLGLVDVKAGKGVRDNFPAFEKIDFVVAVACKVSI